MGLIAIPLAGPRGAFTFAWYAGLLALAIGYFYALTINGVLLIRKRGGCVRNSADAR